MREPSLFARFVEWLREAWCKVFGHDWIEYRSDDVYWCKRCGAEKKKKYYIVDDKGNLQEVSLDDDGTSLESCGDEKESIPQSNHESKPEEVEAVLQSELESTREQLEKFTELLTCYLQVKQISYSLAYDNGQVQAALNELFAFVGELINGSLKWNKGVPKDNRPVLVCFLHSDGEYYHDKDRWCPETKEWEYHNDKHIVGWLEVPPYTLEKEQEYESD